MRWVSLEEGDEVMMVHQGKEEVLGLGRLERKIVM